MALTSMEKECRRSPIEAVEAEAALFLRADELKTKEAHGGTVLLLREQIDGALRLIGRKAEKQLRHDPSFLSASAWKGQLH